SRAAAQDMALSQILIEGEEWKEAPRDSEVFRPVQSVLSPGLDKPTCAVKSIDGGTMFAGAAVGKYVWAFRVDKDGALDAGQPYCSLRVPRGEKDMPVTSLCVDNAGRIYAATPLGLQIFDPTGRLSGVLPSPTREAIRDANLVEDMLYIAAGREVFVRKVK